MSVVPSRLIVSAQAAFCMLPPTKSHKEYVHEAEGYLGKRGTPGVLAVMMRAAQSPPLSSPSCWASRVFSRLFSTQLLSSGFRSGSKLTLWQHLSTVSYHGKTRNSFPDYSIDFIGLSPSTQALICWGCVELGRFGTAGKEMASRDINSGRTGRGSELPRRWRLASVATRKSLIHVDGQIPRG